MRNSGMHFLFIIFLFCAACGGGGTTSNPPVTDNTWTVMIYLDGDNNLSEESLSDLEEMKAVGSTGNVTVIVQHDTVGGPPSNTTHRYKVEKGKLVQLANPGELNMADPETLKDFVVDAVAAYPADHYALILWNHGQGWKNIKSVLTDVDNGTTMPLSNRDLKQALLDARAASGVTLDILGIDACQMSVIEAAYEFRSVARILVSSQEDLPGSGWDYDDLLTRLTSTPVMSPPELATAMVASFKTFYTAAGNTYSTISALALQKGYSSDKATDIAAVAEEVDAVAENLTARMADAATRAATLKALTTARSSVQAFGTAFGSKGYTYIDLMHFARLIRGNNSDLEQVYRRILLAEYHGSERPNAHGLSVVFYDRNNLYDKVLYDPDYRVYDPEAKTGSEIEFLKDFSWDDMLHTYYRYQFPDKPT